MNTHQIVAETVNKLAPYMSRKKAKEIIKAAIEKATKQAWQEHDDVVDALRVANETIKQLGARNQQLRAAQASEKWTVERLVTALGFGLDGQHMKDLRKTYQKVVDEINESRAAHASESPESAYHRG